MCPIRVGTSRSTKALESGSAKLWVLLVGVNQYQDSRLPTLSYSALDCQGLGEAIAAATQTFPNKTVIMHHDFALVGNSAELAHVRSISEQIAGVGRLPMGTLAVTRCLSVQPPQLQAVRASLHQVVTQAQPQDTVLFYFSGHGILEPESQYAFLCLADTNKEEMRQTGLGMQELLGLLSQCCAHQQLVWLDACHSGGMSFRVAKGEQEPTILPNPTPQLMELLRQRAAQSKGFYALLSCDQNQQSWEFPELGHGVFTYYLMRGLLGEAADSQGVIEADALYKYVYYQTLQYIDKTNQQLRLINQQKRGRGDLQLQPEYPLQTPKRIVEGIGELILGVKSAQPEAPPPRRALVVDGWGSSSMSLSLSKALRGIGGFDLQYFPQAGKNWDGVREAIQTCLQSGQEGLVTPGTTTALLYLHGRVEQSETGDALLVLKGDVRLSRSWLRQELRRSPATQQLVILDCPGSSSLADWVEDLQIDPDRGQCLIAASAPPDLPEQFTRVLVETLVVEEPQAGLSAAGWIAQLQRYLAGSGIVPHIWLSGTQGVIEIVPGQLRSRTIGAAEGFDLGLCPYLGLRAFTEDDAPFFFGREQLTRQLLPILAQHSFLAVVGASGSGKSSVVQAGVMAQVRQGTWLPGSEAWWMGVLRPGDRPLDALARVFVEGDTEKERALHQLQVEGILYQGVEDFVYWLRSRSEPTFVLVIDQCEELFTLAGADDRQRFLDLVLGAVDYAGDRFKLILTLRSDFIAPCLEIPALAQRLQQFSVLVPPCLSQDSYRQIILNPAEKVGLTVDPELVEVLLEELSHGAGDLPLLEFVLEQIWENRQPGALTLQVYQQQIGGLKGALERKAQAIYDTLDPDAQACTRWIFLSLTQLGEGTEDTRRRIAKSDLVVKKYSSDLVERTLQILVAAKLVVVSLEGEGGTGEAITDPPGGQRGIDADDHTDKTTRGKPPAPISPAPISPAHSSETVTVEVAHEILIRHWSTLRWWLEENRVRLRSQRQIEQAAHQWKQSGRQSDFLLRGVRLDAAEELYVKHTDELSRDVQEFIEAGLEERQHEQAYATRRLQQAQRAIAVIGTLGLCTAAFGGVAYWQQQQARLNQIRALNALSEAQLLSHQQLEALTTGLQAAHHMEQLPGIGISSPTLTTLRLQTLATLQQAVQNTQERNRLEGHGQRVSSVSVSPDGQWIASGSDDGTVRVWAADGTLLQSLEDYPERVTGVAFSPDGRWLAGGGTDGFWLWEIKQGQRVSGRSLLSNTWVTDVAWSPDGSMVAVATRDQGVQLWAISSETLIKTIKGHQGWVNAVHFSPTGETLVTGGEDRTVRLWQVTDGTLLQTWTGSMDRVLSVAFSPDGRQVVSGSGDRTIRVWTVADGTTRTLQGHTDAVNQVQFSPDGQRLLSGSADQTVRLWQVEDGRELETLQGHGDAVLDVAFSPNGRYILSASADKTVRQWTLDSSLPTGTPAVVAAIGAENKIAAADRDGSVQIWRAEPSGQLSPLDTLPKSEARVTALEFSPDAQILALGNDVGEIRLWDEKTQRQGRSLPGHQSKITSLQFNSDGRLLASSSEDKTVRLWNMADGTLLHTLTGHQDGISQVAFNLEGTLVATGSYDTTVRLWRPDGTLVRTLEGHQLGIAAIAFHPSGEILATASWDNTIQVWRVRDGQRLYTLTGHENGVTSLIFSPDGRSLISGSADHTIKLWNVTDGGLLKTLIGHSDGIESLRISPDGTWMISISEADGLRVWNFDFDELLQQGCDRLQDYLTVHPVGTNPPICSYF